MKLARSLSVLTVCALPTVTVLAQGPLTPGAAPAPTMRTLDEVEPRGMIKGMPVVIAQSGSYYLTGDLICPAPGINGIDVQADNVTIDLRGFTLYGPGAASGNGIQSTFKNLTVLNGRVTGWQGSDPKSGLAAAGISASGAMALIKDVTAYSNNLGVAALDGARFENVGALNNLSDGLSVRRDSVLDGCRAEGNGGDGIAANEASTMTQCAALGNHGRGIHTASAIAQLTACVTIRGCTARLNTLDGIFAENGAHILSCVSDLNGIMDSQANNHGIRITAGALAEGIYPASIVRDCVANNNMGHGIYVDRETLVTGNACSGNGRAPIDPQFTPPWAGIFAENDNNTLAENNASSNVGTIPYSWPVVGIRVDGFNNRIDGNHCSMNATWAFLLRSGTGNFVVRNTGIRTPATIDYSIVAGNFVGRIGFASALGGALPAIGYPAGGLGITDPWANFDD